MSFSLSLVHSPFLPFCFPLLPVFPLLPNSRTSYARRPRPERPSRGHSGATSSSAPRPPCRCLHCTRCPHHSIRCAHLRARTWTWIRHGFGDRLMFLTCAYFQSKRLPHLLPGLRVPGPLMRVVLRNARPSEMQRESAGIVESNSHLWALFFVSFNLSHRIR